MKVGDTLEIPPFRGGRSGLFVVVVYGFLYHGEQQ